MDHLEFELSQLKIGLLTMWTLVTDQLAKSKDAFVNQNITLASEVIYSDPEVSALGLGINKDCENIFSKYSPISADRKLLLMIIKVNTYLKRQGDCAKEIARCIIGINVFFDKQILDITQIVDMFNENIMMQTELMKAFEKEDCSIARKSYRRNEILDTINNNSTSILAQYIKSSTDKSEQALQIISIIRKLERAGDSSKNIAQEIILYSEAKALKLEVH